MPAGSTPLDHTSILKTVEQRWGLPSLTARDAAAPGFGDVLTLTTPGTHVEAPATAVRFAGLVNDCFAAVIRSKRGRFTALATLPLNSPAASVKELERACRQLGLAVNSGLFVAGSKVDRPGSGRRAATPGQGLGRLTGGPVRP